MTGNTTFKDCQRFHRNHLNSKRSLDTIRHAVRLAETHEPIGSQSSDDLNKNGQQKIHMDFGSSAVQGSVKENMCSGTWCLFKLLERDKDDQGK